MKGCKFRLLAVSLCAPLAAQAAEPKFCTSARFTDIDWTDTTVTTAVTRQTLESLSCKAKVNLFSVPMAYRSLANSDLDVFLGSWMPTMTNDIRQYAEKGTVETLRADPEGAKCTLAVPQYVYNGDLRSFADVVKFSDKLGDKIYGIRPGSNDDRVVQSMIDENTFELGKFKLVESSEAGMLSQIQRAIRRGQWVVFLDWEPYPMNTHFQMKHPEGGDDFLGLNYGGTTIYTNVRRGYVQECANVGQLLKNLNFTLEMENKLMGAVLNENKRPEEATKAWLKGHPEQLDTWPASVTTRDRQPATAAAKLAFAKWATDRSFPALDGP